MTQSSPLELIFFGALEKHSDAERRAYLDHACAGNAELRNQIERMLAAQADAGSFMERPAFTRDTTHFHATPITETSGTIIGPYKLLQQIGEGGFGVVYMAEQEKPVKRRVALKVIKAGMDTKAVIARFEAERQALALMDHPNIARVLDAGATDTGRPYFVMELVKGIPITEYCDQANLRMRQRLELFTDICRAVQHAHQKGIIHRDLKPSNIMITLHDAKPVVKVIDFGIAKATDQKLTEKTLFTNYGQMIGTPVYMSPEQAVMSGLDVDTRSDVYSLGVLLYELLTGSPPFDAKMLRSAGFDEMRRIIREEQPQKPSTRLSTLAEDIKLTVAGQRQVSPQALRKQLHGDLDWIILKAIEKDRSRRYESASALAQDIERHLKSEPVTAAAPSARYKLRKFMQRNKGPMAAAALFATLLVVGTAVSTWQAIRATHATGRAVAAVQEKDTALIAANAANAQSLKRLTQIQKANDILGSIFENLDPREISKQDRPLQAILVETLDKAVEQLEGEAVGEELVVAAMQIKFGASLLNLGEPAKAIVLLKKARATRQAKLGLEHPDTLNSMFYLATAYKDSGQLNLALPLSEETLKLRIAALGPDNPETLNSMNNLAVAYQAAGKLDLALPLLKEALERRRMTRGPDHPHTIASMNNLATAYQTAGRADLALPLLEESLRLMKATHPPGHPDTLITMSNLASAYQHAGKMDLALPLMEETLKIKKATLGPEHPQTIISMVNLANAYQEAWRLDLAMPLMLDTLRLATAKLGPGHPVTLASMDNLAHAYWEANQLDKSIPLFEESFKRREMQLGRGHPETVQAAANVGVNYKDAGRLAEALPLLEEAYLAAKNYPNLRWVGAPLLESYLLAGKFEAAVVLAKELLVDARKTFPSDSPQLAEQLAVLGRSLLQAKANSDAELLFRECLAIREKTQPDEWTTFNTKSMLAGALLGQKKYADAEPLLLNGYQGMHQRETAIPAPAKVRLTETLERLIALYEARGGDGDLANARKYHTLLEQRKAAEKEAAISTK